jgi:hypothetical protein
MYSIWNERFNQAANQSTVSKAYREVWIELGKYLLNLQTELKFEEHPHQMQVSR